ncbi:hypothetical protein [Pseudoroseomonas ludipueritiae]|uniref:GtrA-like protein domain-containing protein n=1 Tax=Pseudoroseomonas ludipueritiae TaxID=198093 RepID=A0ABR7RCK5_9PROT|nr:hypothetical protein [Pseudoroseomonas ludipueritiae]MBC9179584.1 hypothetical protein [Pseudoroseomonas ludipueritiae]
MPKRTINYLLHPFRGEEWGELSCAVIGGIQFFFAIIFYHDLTQRPGLALTIALSPQSWTCAGLILAVMHVLALRFGGAKWGYQARLCAAGSSLVFWSHFVFSIFVNALLSGAQVPAMLVPAMMAPLVAGVVLYRLWRHY